MGKYFLLLIFAIITIGVYSKIKDCTKTDFKGTFGDPCKSTDDCCYTVVPISKVATTRIVPTCVGGFCCLRSDKFCISDSNCCYSKLGPLQIGNSPVTCQSTPTQCAPCKTGKQYCKEHLGANQYNHYPCCDGSKCQHDGKCQCSAKGKICEPGTAHNSCCTGKCKPNGFCP